MRADGSAARRITVLPRSASNDLGPRFSPNGKRLLFTRVRGEGRTETGALFTVRLDGTGLRRLTTFALHVEEGDWSPDGTRIVFHAHPDPDTRADVYVIDPNGRHLTNLTRNPALVAGSDDPVWSPDGR
jgi:Tol biopolymer transport system component